MKCKQFQYIPASGWSSTTDAPLEDPDFILAFGSGEECDGGILNQWHQENYPGVILLGCSTAGEILDTSVSIKTMIVTAVKLEKSSAELVELNFEPGADSFNLGEALAEKCPHEGLRLFFVLSDGLHVNGTKLVEGIVSALPANVIVTGGLAGDGVRFEQTQLIANENWGEYKVAALCLYGEDLNIGFGSLGGWDSFGPDRLITKAKDNVLYQLDGQSALSLYKNYLGDHAKELPSSGQRFPLKVTTPSGKQFVRTLLAIDDQEDSMTFAGDMPEGSYARLMKANFDRLVDGAIGAAEATSMTPDNPAQLAILISCVGRAIVLKQRVEEEVEGVRSVLGESPVLTGFYSYGEICPLIGEVGCVLHNQTMTITTLSES